MATRTIADNGGLGVIYRLAQEPYKGVGIAVKGKGFTEFIFDPKAYNKHQSSVRCTEPEDLDSGEKKRKKRRHKRR